VVVSGLSFAGTPFSTDFQLVKISFKQMNSSGGVFRRRKRFKMRQRDPEKFFGLLDLSDLRFPEGCFHGLASMLHRDKADDFRMGALFFSVCDRLDADRFFPPVKMQPFRLHAVVTNLQMEERLFSCGSVSFFGIQGKWGNF